MQPLGHRGGSIVLARDDHRHFHAGSRRDVDAGGGDVGSSAADRADRPGRVEAGDAERARAEDALDGERAVRRRFASP